MPSITKTIFPDGGAGRPPVHAYTVSNENGMLFTAIEYGAVITDVRVPDREQRSESVVLGFDSLKPYVDRPDLYFGAAVGRFAGRISNAAFTLNGTVFHLPANEGPNSLHGNGEFSTCLWKAETREGADEASVVFSYTSPDGSNGFPGSVSVTVTYTLHTENKLDIRIDAESDRDTVFNPTNHTYFNLSGNCRSSVTAHRITADVNGFLELGEGCIPTGAILPVDETAFDFRKERPISDGVRSQNPQNVKVRNGYDHAILFRPEGSHTVRLREPVSGRVLSLQTDAPCFVLYTGNYLDNSFAVHNGVPGQKHLGAAIEAQGFPDAPNHSNFPDVVLPAGTPFSRNISWTFTTE